jgi:hypothetical protein
MKLRSKTCTMTNYSAGTHSYKSCGIVISYATSSLDGHPRLTHRLGASSDKPYNLSLWNRRTRTCFIVNKLEH